MPQTPVMLRKTRAKCPHAMMQCKCQNQNPFCSSSSDACTPSHPPAPPRPPTTPNLLDHPPPIHRLPRRPLDTPRHLPPHTPVDSLPIPVFSPQRRQRNRRRRRRHVLLFPRPIRHLLLVIVHVLRLVQADSLLQPTGKGPRAEQVFLVRDLDGFRVVVGVAGGDGEGGERVFEEALVDSLRQEVLARGGCWVGWAGGDVPGRLLGTELGGGCGGGGVVVHENAARGGGAWCRGRGGGGGCSGREERGIGRRERLLLSAGG